MQSISNYYYYYIKLKSDLISQMQPKVLIRVGDYADRASVSSVVSRRITFPINRRYATTETRSGTVKCFLQMKRFACRQKWHVPVDKKKSPYKLEARKVISFESISNFIIT